MSLASFLFLILRRAAMLRSLVQPCVLESAVQENDRKNRGGSSFFVRRVLSFAVPPGYVFRVLDASEREKGPSWRGNGSGRNSDLNCR